MAKADSKEIFENYSIPKAVRVMALPTVISQLIVLIYNMADTLYLGMTDNPYMVAGVSLILPIFNICLSLAGLTGIGGGAVISQKLGENRPDEAKKVSCFSFYLSIAVTAVFSVLTISLMRPILNLLGASENTYEYAKQYVFCVVVLGGIPTVLSNVMANLLRSVGSSKEAGFGITMGGILNIALDPLFMFAILPPGKEVLGVGLATLISNCAACIYFLAVVFHYRGKIPIGFGLRQGLPEGKNIALIFKIGVPSSVATLLFDLDYVIIDKLMTTYSDVAMAAVGIVLKAERLPLNVGIGICQGMLPIVAYNYSAKNDVRMKKTIKFSLILGLIIAAASVVLYEALAPYIIKIFIRDTETLQLGTRFLRIRCLATPLMFISFFTVYVFQGFGEGNISLMLGVARWAVFNIPMLFLMNYLVGINGLVWSQSCADILTVILSISTYVIYNRKKAKRNSETLP